LLVESIAQTANPPLLLGPLRNHQLASLSEANDTWDIQRSRTVSPLMASPVHLSRQPHSRPATAHVQGSDAFGTIHLVGGNGGQVNVHLLHVERRLTDALHRISVQENSSLTSHAPYLFDGLNGAHFVVGQHDADQDRPIRQRRL